MVAEEELMGKMGKPGKPVITLATDFGTVDGYVAAMKGVILTHAPETNILDLGHELPPHDIRHAAFLPARPIRFSPRDRFT